MTIKKILLVITFGFGLLFGSYGLANPSTQTQKFTPKQVKQIQNVVHEYLLQNPQIMVEVFQKLQQQQQANMEKKALEGIHANAKALFDSPLSPAIGNKKGNVTLVEFFDYQCPHCKAMAKVIEKVAKKDKNIKIVFKEFPIFPGSMFAAKAALASVEQGKYFEFHNALMADKNPLTKQDVLDTAKKVGLNIEQLEKAMKSKKIDDELQQNLKLAEDIGLAGTPAFIVQSNASKNKTFFIPGQVSAQVLQNLIQKAS